MKKIPAPVPAPEKPQSSRQLSLFSRIMMLIITALLLVMGVFTLLDTRGLHLLVPEIITVSGALVIVAALLWLGVGIYNRIRSEKVKTFYRIAGLSIGMGVAMFIVVMAIQITMFAMPHTYGDIESPAGRQVVILRMNDVGAGSEEEYLQTMARMNARAAHLNGEAPADAAAAVAQDSYPAEAYGYIYLAMPKKLGIFYSSDVVLDGAIYRGEASKSGLRYEWLDDNTVRFYLTDPEPGDEGEMTLHLNP